jgi:hypothetical protein
MTGRFICHLLEAFDNDNDCDDRSAWSRHVEQDTHLLINLNFVFFAFCIILIEEGPAICPWRIMLLNGL